MRSWVWILIVGAGGYWVYNAWFTEQDSAEDDQSVVLDVSGDRSKVAPGTAGADGAETGVKKGGGGGDPGSSAAGHRTMGIDGDLGADPARRDSGERPRPSREDAAARALERELKKARTGGDRAAQKRIGARLLKDHPESNAARWLRLEMGKRHLRAYRERGSTKEGIAEARRAWRELTPALFITDASEGDKERLREILGQLADTLLFSSRHIEGFDRTYKPRSGDTLNRLCRRVFPQWGARLSPGFVAHINGLSSPKGLRAGEPIKVPVGEVQIRVQKHEFRLYVLFDGCYVRDFPVGLGKTGSTPLGRFVIGKMMKNPDWYPQAGVRVPYGDPENVLGTRWMGFKNTAEYRGFGIHGTKQPNSIGRAESSGCVRMLRRDVEMLYGWTRPGTSVRILR